MMTLQWLGLALSCLSVQRTEVDPSPAGGAAETSYPVHVWLHVQSGVPGGELPAGGIHVALGVMPGSERDDNPEPEALPRERHRPVLAEATSDERGEIRIAVPVPLEWRGRSSFLWVRVETPGFTQRTLRLHPRDAQRAELLNVYRGGTLFGRSVSAAGEGVGGARVWLVRADGRTTSDRTLPNGGFALDFLEPGTHRVHARHPALGSSPKAVVPLDPAGPPSEVVLTLGGGVELTARVVDPLGEPVPAAWITLVPAGSTRALTLAECVELEAEGGLCGGRARSDRAGRVTFPALRPGAYDARAAWTHSEDDLSSLESQGELVGRVELDAAPGDVPTLVFPAHRVEVEVRDATGMPVVARPDAQGEPAFAPLSLHQFVDDGLTLRWMRHAPGWMPCAPAGIVQDLAVFPVRPGREVLVSWQEPDVPHYERRITVEDRPWRVPFVLELQPRGKPAALTLHFRDPDGGELSRPRVEIRAPESGRVLLQSLVPGLPPLPRFAGSEWSLELPPGRYAVWVSSEPWMGCVIPSPLPRTPYFPARLELELGAGESRNETVRLGAAAHLDLQAREPVKPPGPSAFVKDNRFDYEGACTRLGGRRLSLVCGEQRHALESLDVPGLLLGPGGLDWLLPGWSARGLDPLPPGDWTLRIEGPEDSVTSIPVHLEPGQVTTVLW